MPQRGPDAMNRISEAILKSDEASAEYAFERPVSASLLPSSAKLFDAGLKGIFVFSAMIATAAGAKSGWQFRPVPTAVPPRGISSRPGKMLFTLPACFSIWAA